MGELVEQEDYTPIDPTKATPVTLLAQALERGMDPETLGRFMDLQERYEADQARKAYASDMAKCQKALPQIVATAVNDQTSSHYAKLEHINAAITPVYTKHGFSISFGEEPIEGDMIRIVAKVLHKLGHIETFIYDLPLDLVGIRGSENKTAVHAKGSSTSYARRYLTTMIFNLTIGDDIDGNALGGNGFVSEQQALELSALVVDWGLNESALLRELGIREWRVCPSKKYEKAKERINQIGKAREKS